jgi:hypothetical protein
MLQTIFGNLIKHASKKENTQKQGFLQNEVHIRCITLS